MSKSVVTREAGIPGSDAAEQIAALGGPVAQRKNRATSTSTGPRPLTFQRSDPPRLDADVQETTDIPLESDVASDGELEEDWRPRRTTTLAERRRRLTEQRTGVREVVTTPGARSLPAPHARVRHGGIAPLVLGALLLIALYVIGFWVYALGLGVYNHWAYGPTPTAHLEAVIGDHDAPDHPTAITAMNLHGSIIILIAPGGDFAHVSSYTLPALTSSAFGNLDNVMITLTIVGHGDVLVQLQGGPDLLHFWQRPELRVLLVNQHPGFTLVPAPAA